MTTVTLSLVSHTNVGKTTLARTLLGRDVGEVRDAPHVTEWAEEHLLLATPGGHRLVLWDTPGFGDSVRLARRMRQSGHPLGWVLSQVWDRFTDRAFWMSQQALRHVRSGSDVLLYLVNASEPEAGYLASEMQLLAWTGVPTLVLLNQLGVPREAVDEEAELQAWRDRLAPWAHVKAVLPLDAFARCWVHEQVLLEAVQQALRSADAPARPEGSAADALPKETAGSEKARALVELRAAWAARHESVFDAATAELAASLARLAHERAVVEEAAGLGQRLREWGTRLAQSTSEDTGSASPQARAEKALSGAIEAEVRASTARLLALHGLEAAQRPGLPNGDANSLYTAASCARTQAASSPAAAPHSASSQPAAAAPDPVAVILARVAAQIEPHRRVPEGRAAVLGGAITGALAGLKADVATGGLTLGGGLLAGGLLGALGAAGLARGINLVRGTGRSWVRLGDAALPALAEAALLRYLAVAHYGRGRGEWAEAEAPPHWPAAVQAALAARREALERLWKGRPEREPAEADTPQLASALQPLLRTALRDTFAALYPGVASVGAAPRDNGRT